MPTCLCKKAPKNASVATGGCAFMGTCDQPPAALPQSTRWTIVALHGSVPAQLGSAPATSPFDRHMPGHAFARRVPSVALKETLLAQLQRNVAQVGQKCI